MAHLVSMTMILLLVLTYLLSTYTSIYTLAMPTLAERSLNSTNATTNLSQLRAPPNPYTYWYDSAHLVIFDRRKAKHSKENPTTNVYNFKHAIQDAGRRIIAMQERTHVQGNAWFPSNEFVYEEAMARPAAVQPHVVRRIKLEIRGINTFLHLSYDAIKLVMLGLIEYTALWDIGHGDSDRVSMCNFTLYWLEYGGQRIAEGAVNIKVPDLPTQLIATS